jgi:hypothetical protein
MLSIFQQSTNELMYGPILSKYMENLIAQISSSKPPLNPSQSYAEITIDPSYEAFTSGVQQFHATTIAMIDRNPYPNNSQLQEIFSAGKMKAFEEFYAKGGATSPQFRKMLEEYIEGKEREVTEAYSGESQNRNLQIL